MKTLTFITFQLFIITYRVKSFPWVDCTYNRDTKHVEYICEGEMGYRFGYRTDFYLYCNNYMAAIDRQNVRILSFCGCHEATPPNAIINHYNGLRVYNLSSTGIEMISAEYLEYHKFLEVFMASSNELAEIPLDLFRYTPKITAIDFSFNQIQAIDPVTFDNIRRLKKIQFNHNLISELDTRLFASLFGLEFLDLRSNRIKAIESNLFTNNRKLKSLNFNDNQVKRLDCAFLLKFANSHSVNILLNTLEELQTNCANERIDMDFGVKFAATAATAATIHNGQYEWIFSKLDFNKLFHLNFANSRKMNVSALLEQANAQLLTLDVSNTFIGGLNEKTLERFINLKELYLCRTNLPNIWFGAFHHQINLKILDISFNNFGQFDFYLFLRNFQKLEILNLEGNDLTEIDSLSRLYFPMLNTIILSNNRFTCEYLTKFQNQWNGLTLINNPSNQVFMDGVHCIYPHFTPSSTEISTEMYQPIFYINDDDTSKANIEFYADQSQEVFIFTIVSIALAAILLTFCLCFACSKCIHKMKRYQVATESVSFQNQDDDNRNIRHGNRIDIE